MVQPVMKQILNVDKDAFSSGQIGSKIWLCEELEQLFETIDSVWIYGGWYGISAFLLQSRGNINIGQIRSYDLDPQCEEVADMINENWVIDNWKFKAKTQDCNLLDLDWNGPDLVINTSTEHFESLDWWNAIPKGTTVALQGNNMPHEEHHIHSNSLDDFIKSYPVDTLLFRGQKEFVYPTWKFTRFMLIGVK
jgi:hypothetical protein